MRCMYGGKDGKEGQGRGGARGGMEGREGAREVGGRVPALPPPPPPLPNLRLARPALSLLLRYLQKLSSHPNIGMILVTWLYPGKHVEVHSLSRNTRAAKFSATAIAAWDAQDESELSLHEVCVPMPTPGVHPAAAFDFLPLLCVGGVWLTLLSPALRWPLCFRLDRHPKPLSLPAGRARAV